MGIATTSFVSVLEDAKRGELQLPEFQRDWIWNRNQVVELLDSLRQRYPIGSLLFMERNPDIGIVARPFAGTADILEVKEPATFVLDGQQRITSGLALYYGLGGTHYYLDLAQIWKLATEQDVDLTNSRAIAAFLTDLDPDDGYCIGRNRRDDPLALLVPRHLLHTAVLHDDDELRKALKRYAKAYPDREDFVEVLIRDRFKLSADVQVPVTTIEKNRPVEAVSRIFATLNTTGKPLNSFELVVAILYPSGIRLRSDIEENRELYPVYSHMDRTGEIYLQSVAMLANASPKKAQLPKTIKPDIYKRNRNDAVDLLDKLGRYLTSRLGVGLDHSSLLIPYDSIFAPMSIVLRELNRLGLKGAERAQADIKLETWFVASALSNRYQEGVHNKQVRDRDDMIAWIEARDAGEPPQWIKDFRVPILHSDTPDGAVGRLLRCLINARSPKDPVTGLDVGERPKAVSTSKHHIFPTRWVDKYLKGWKGTCDLALNVTLISQETNGRWVNVDPANQVQEMEAAANSPASLKSTLRAHFLDSVCVEIMKRQDKTAADFEEFLLARQNLFIQEFESKWNLLPASPLSLAIDDDDSLPGG
ncbi:MAG: DUF262 domain-containing protein [Chloroflexi bacterium]|nr:DUF262 domain-containing protein [Chloroflexota bacterium]